MTQNELLAFIKDWFQKTADPQVDYVNIDADGSASLDGGWQLNQLADTLFHELQRTSPSIMVVLTNCEAAEAFSASRLAPA